MRMLRILGKSLIAWESELINEIINLGLKMLSAVTPLTLCHRKLKYFLFENSKI